jgi:hypothetical protein
MTEFKISRGRHIGNIHDSNLYDDLMKSHEYLQIFRKVIEDNDGYDAMNIPFFNKTKKIV